MKRVVTGDLVHLGVGFHPGSVERGLIPCKDLRSLICFPIRATSRFSHPPSMPGLSDSRASRDEGNEPDWGWGRGGGEVTLGKAVAEIGDGSGRPH